MADNIFRGDAPAVAQVNTVTPTASNSQTYTITINGKIITFTADASATVAEITAGLTTAFNASTEPEFAEITAADITTAVTLTADTAGVPFTNTSSATGAGTLVTVITTASAGPKDWSTAGNWSAGTVPISTNDVFIPGIAVDILYGLAQSGVTLTSLTINQAYTGSIGLPERNASGYDEYRATYLAISATTTHIGRGEGLGSGRIKLDTGANAATVNVYNTGITLETGIESVLWKGNNSANAVNVFDGTAGIAVLSGETTSMGTLRVMGGTVRSGTGVTMLVKEQSGGTLTTLTNVTTTCNQNGGVHYHAGGSIAGTTNIDGGTMIVTSSAGGGTLNISSGGVVDFSQDTRGVTFTFVNMNAGATLKDPYGRLTATNGIDLERCSIPEVTIDVGFHKKLTIGAPT